MQANLPSSNHRLVALAVLETYVRYTRVLQQQQQQHVIPTVLTSFMDARGMGHPSEVRACVGGDRWVRGVAGSKGRCPLGGCVHMV